jgi:dihydrofolate reductase
MAKRAASKKTQTAHKRKIIVLVAISADGFIARLDGSFDWLDRPRPKGNYGMDEFYKSIDTILWGRKTYDLALAFQNKGMAGAAFDTRLKNYLFSRTLKASGTAAGVELVGEPVKAFTARLRAGKGKNIWMMGGGGIIASFVDEGEIDEFIISVIPKFIGEGIPLIAPRHRDVTLQLISSKAFPDGVVKLHYAVPK